MYQAFGPLVISSGSTVNPCRYIGLYEYYFDTDTGLYQVRARPYVPSVGRFPSPDPLGAPADVINSYRYVYNSPTNAADPAGLIAVFIGGTGEKHDDPDQTIPGLWWEYPEKKNNDKKIFYPVAKIYEYADAMPVVTVALKDVKEALEQAKAKCKNEKVYVFGFSRGAITGFMLVEQLDRLGIPVRFLGTIDPVRTFVKDYHRKESVIPKNVENASNLIKKPPRENVPKGPLHTHPVEGAHDIPFENLERIPTKHQHLGKTEISADTMKREARKAGVKWKEDP
jgi:RHS repeat-associated protein